MFGPQSPHNQIAGSFPHLWSSLCRGFVVSFLGHYFCHTFPLSEHLAALSFTSHIKSKLLRQPGLPHLPRSPDRPTSPGQANMLNMMCPSSPHVTEEVNCFVSGLGVMIKYNSMFFKKPQIRHNCIFHCFILNCYLYSLSDSGFMSMMIKKKLVPESGWTVAQL